MASKRVGFYVVVTPVERRQYPWVATMEDQAADLVTSIKRHVDHVAAAYAVYDFACKSCGAKWTEKSHDYNGGCCDADEANNPNPEPLDAH